eukprot:752077-Pyramimonas_sp.AAC.1
MHPAPFPLGRLRRSPWALRRFVWGLSEILFVMLGASLAEHGDLLSELLGPSWGRPGPSEPPTWAL